MGNIALRKALEDYKTIYMPYRNFAERTREEYQNDLKDLLDFSQKLGIDKANKITLPAIERYVANLEQRGFSSFTRKRKVVAIRSFLLFLYQDGYIATNIAKQVVLPFTESTTPHVLTQIECDRLRAASTANPRDRAIIEVLLQTGIKLSELIGLSINDIDLGKSEKEGDEQVGFIRVLGNRSKKERLVPLNGKASDAVSSYLKDRDKTENNTLFLNKYSEPVSQRGMQKILRKYFKRAGIANASVHTLRHTFAAYQVSKGKDLKTIQEMMGHRDRRSTMIYRDLTPSLH